MRVLVAQIGARRHYSVPRALERVNALYKLKTDACADVAPWSWLRHVPFGVGTTAGGRKLLERSVAGVSPEKIDSLLLFTIVNALQPSRGQLATTRWAEQNERFCRLVVRKGFGMADSVYAFNAAAKEIFEAARCNGIRSVLDQTAAPWRWNSRLLAEEAERWPDWEEVPAEIDLDGRLSERELREWEIADAIICGSRFVVDSLEECGVARDKCVEVRYPAPLMVPPPRDEPRRGSRGGPLRVLFVGSVQLRKGIQYLWEAKRSLGDSVNVRVLGRSQLSDKANGYLATCMDLRGPVPRGEVTKHFEWADVLVLPTLSEGSANICIEAQATGLPVLTTDRAGSLIVDGWDGWLMPARDVESIVQRLGNASSVREMRSRLSRDNGPKKIRGLQEYAEELIAAIGGTVSQCSSVVSSH